MKVLVCGGRDFNDAAWLFTELQQLHMQFNVTMIIQGEARGADSIAKRWAIINQVPCLSVPAEWNLYGKSAGYKRNAKMLTYAPDRVLAAPGGKGTKMMCELARKEGVYVQELHKEESSTQA